LSRFAVGAFDPELLGADSLICWIRTKKTAIPDFGDGFDRDLSSECIDSPLNK